ncbi:hypothetical protein [Chitiniphilus eburneus]|uniref:hypothetical protein n=1 Tax=Chitiniphilus eburneus TaxID=2571148 RepID=UPI0035D10E13
MRKIVNGVVAVSGVILLAACGNQGQPSGPAHPDASTVASVAVTTPAVTPTVPTGPHITNAAGVEFIVADSNDEEVATYAAQRADAQAYLEKLHRAVKDILQMTALPEGAELPAQSRKMNALAKEGDIFGAPFQPNAPFAYCRSAGISADQFWKVLAGSIPTGVPADALTKYNDDATACGAALLKPPKAVVTLYGPSDQNKPPFKGCLSVLQLEPKKPYSIWTCPASVAGK